jgi:hypothetical protein
MTHIDRNNRLSHLRAEIVVRDADVRAAAKAGVVAAIAAGVALIESKAILGHGEFSRWIEAQTGLAPRTARLYMNLASHRDRVEAKLATVASLTIREAARLVAGLGQRAARHRLEPRDGHLLVATDPGGKYQITIYPSAHAGFFHVACIIDPADGGPAELCTTKKPCSAATFVHLEENLGTTSIGLSIEQHLSEAFRKNPLDEAA